MKKCGGSVKIARFVHRLIKSFNVQEVQLSPRDRAMRRVN